MEVLAERKGRLNYMRKNLKSVLKKVIDNKAVDKLKSIAVSTYILTVFFWTVLTICMILLVLIAIDLHDAIEKLVMWNIVIIIALTGGIILFGVLTIFKKIEERYPILWIYLLLMIIFFAIPIGLITVSESKIIITLFIIVTYIMNFFPAYFLAREIVGSYKGFKELFTKKITKITTTYEEKNVTKEITTEENPIGIIIFSIVIPVVLSVIKLLVSN